MIQPGSKGKLVRDRIPDIIRAAGGDPQTELLDAEGYSRSLAEKLREEVQELLDAEGDHVLEELADVLEVLHAIAANHGNEWDAVEATRLKKAEERGGFQGKVFLLEP